MEKMYRSLLKNNMMKRVLLIILVGLFSLQSFGQNGALYQNWYLISYEYDENIFNVSEIFPHIEPTLTIEQNLEYSGYAACNNYTGSFDYDSTNDLLTMNSFDATLNLCDYQEHNEFETVYFNFFANPNIIDYSIVYDTNGDENLYLESSSGVIFHYRNSQIIFSVNDIELFNINLFPNPVSGELFISSENTVVENIVVYSINGKILLETVNETNSINVSALSKGIYFIELSSSEGKSIQRFIKK